MPRPAPSAAALASVALAAAVLACVGPGSERARQEKLARELDGIRYEQPLDTVWTTVIRLLADRGYPLAGKDAELVGQSVNLYDRLTSKARETETAKDGTRTLETGWLAGIRYRAEARPDGRVAFTKIHEDLTEHRRDAASEPGVEMGLALAQRLAPDKAARIEAAAGSGDSGGRR
ncbi:hypothetical protein [Anaeromyxobacter oryzae]|uniref:Lipoprotein n=1 Tax=Anaeromyxobacter oryzae TaxID=2918170 RepID=A0ABM7WP05_9BACT|nr:hypothetical protein [Anaeromyxobacter oryzae]BDG01201.1 hypothetical protein AMOR_01970 [Anaeromyxobacter oryzae]